MAFQCHCRNFPSRRDCRLAPGSLLPTSSRQGYVWNQHTGNEMRRQSPTQPGVPFTLLPYPDPSTIILGVHRCFCSSLAAGELSSSLAPGRHLICFPNRKTHKGDQHQHGPPSSAQWERAPKFWGGGNSAFPQNGFLPRTSFSTPWPKDHLYLGHCEKGPFLSPTLVPQHETLHGFQGLYFW